VLATYLLTFALLACPFHEGKHEQIEAATLAIESAPANVDLWLARAEVYLLHDELGACGDDLAVAQRMAPGESGLVLLQARLAFAQHKPADALTRVDLYLQRKLGGESHNVALHLRAQCLTQLKQTPAAIEAWTLLLKTHPLPKPDWFLERASLQESVPKQGPEVALQGLQQGIQRLGLVVGLVLRAAELEERLGQIDAAVARIETLAVRSARKETWLKRQGDILQRAGRKQQARAYFQRALSAWEHLPTKRRNTFSMIRLYEQIQTSLEELENA
jgi:tetratricopeptide (TPR) repeat protein